jgi:hypothetical protein
VIENGEYIELAFVLLILVNRKERGGNSMTLKRKLIGAVVALLLSLGAASSSHAVLIDLDGGGGLTGAVNIGSFDWNATSFVAQGGQAAVGAFLASGGTCPAGSCTFTVFSQGRLQGVNNPNGDPVVVGGLNTLGGYEITYVAKITETVTGVNATGTAANFSTVAGATGFINIYFSPVNANQINGSQFNDGTLILHGDIVGDSSGNFAIANATSVPLDGSPNGNQWGSQNTISGFGTTSTIPFDNLTVDPAFFQTVLAEFGIEFSNLSQSVPFNSTDPMACFVTLDSNQLQCSTYIQTVGQPYSGQLPDPNGGFIPQVGTVNSGGPTGCGGAFPTACPDFVAQTDPNSPFTAAVPEPTSLLLLGFGLVGLVIYQRRKIAKK